MDPCASLIRVHNLFLDTAELFRKAKPTGLAGGAHDQRSLTMHDAWKWIQEHAPPELVRDIRADLREKYTSMDSDVSPYEFWNRIEHSECDKLPVHFLRAGHMLKNKASPSTLYLFQIIESRLFQAACTRNLKGIAQVHTPDGAVTLVPSSYPSSTCGIISGGSLRSNFSLN